MLCTPKQTRTALLLLAVFVLLSADWEFGPWLTVVPAWARVALILGSGLGAVVTLGWALFQSVQEQRGVQRYLDLVTRLDHHELEDGLAAVAPPYLRKGSPWPGLFCNLQECFRRYAQRLADLEQARATLDIRARRNEARTERIEAILSGLADPVIAVDNYDELMLLNPSAARLFNLDQENVENRALRQLLHCEELIELLTETRRRRVAVQRTSEVEIADPQGTRHWYSITARRIPASMGQSTDGDVAQGAVAVLRDISVQKAIQRRNAEFISAVSHEMKTPLAGIKAYVELLADGEAEDEQAQEEFLEVINSQANRLQRLVDNLLNLARIEAGVIQVNKRHHSLNELLEEAFQIVQPAAESKHIELQMYLSPMYLGVLVDPDMLLQAAINLLSNAVKYTPEGGQVILRSRLVDDEVKFEVQDTGVGLSDEDCSKVFDKFYRVQKDSHMAGGTGLGLPLAKHIVEDVHGGSLTVESRLGQGSTFIITLPSAGQLD